MRRRDFIKVIAGSATAWSFTARAQQTGKLPTIGFLGATDGPSWIAWTAAFAEQLKQLGWIDGRTVAIEYRWSEGRPERVAEVADEFVRQKVDIIVTYGGAVAAFKQATRDIPIVFAIAGDPVGIGLVDSLSHPGGNVTGLSLEQTDVASKRLEILLNVVPRLHRLAVVANVGYAGSASELAGVQATARRLGLEVAPYEIRRAEDIALISQDPKSPAEALYVVEDTLVVANVTHIIELTLTARLPSIFNSFDFVRAGGLMSYGPDYPALFQRAAEYVDKILRGTKPGDLPVEQPTKFDLVINLKTAKTLGVAIPDKILAVADQVIE
jgi:putative tryptophan/tyrosine transport system substrate-binding protein